MRRPLPNAHCWNVRHSTQLSSRPAVAPVSFRPIAFYSLVPIPLERVHVLRSLIEKRLSELGVLGRIYLAPEDGIGGINSQMAVPVGQIANMKKFFDELRADFGPIAFTEGLEELDVPCFRKLRVMIKKDLVGVKQSIKAGDLVDPSSHHLDPADWHKELSENGDKALLVDMRNHYEYDVGHFEHAVKLDVDTFREGLDELQKLCKQQPEKTLYMYCTGGIRCDVTTSYLHQNGIDKFKMLKGGITSYGNYIRSSTEGPVRSLFRGKNFSFDDRRGERITDDVLTTCFQCGKPCDTLHNCANTRCHLLFVQCEACRIAMNKTCSELCSDVLAGRKTWDIEYDYHRQIRPNL
ncbi:Rhodanese-like domain-containing protein [Fennellomyces sp. T-0311]|nr:Rhodanese-like domain-containing protein [Fennellomyces sp. T-0311]